METNVKILVTGASGFLGRHLVKRLLKDRCNVRIFKDDIRNSEAVKKAVKGCDVVFHLAGLISYWSKFNNLQYEVNVRGTKNMVQACLENNVERLIYVSSVAANGIEKNGKLADEETLYNLFPLGVSYCDTKFLAENEVYKGIAKGLDAVIISPASMYGQGDKRKIKSDLTFSFKFPFNLFYIKGGLAVVDVEDVVEGLIQAQKIGKKGEKYLLVSQNLSFYEIRKTVAEVLKKKPPFICIPNRVLLFFSYISLAVSKITNKKPKLLPEIVRLNKLELFFSNKKARQKLGIKFRPFKESIKKAVVWYKTHGYL